MVGGAPSLAPPSHGREGAGPEDLERLGDGSRLVAAPPHDADAAALLLTPDAQKCTPWLWLFSRQPVWKPRKAAAAPLPLTPTWFLVQTPDKKRRLHFVAAGTLRRTLHIKGKGLQEADVEPTPAAVGFVSTKKIVFYMDGKLAGTVLELATDSNGSVLPSVPSVNA